MNAGTRNSLRASTIVAFSRDSCLMMDIYAEASASLLLGLGSERSAPWR